MVTIAIRRRRCHPMGRQFQQCGRRGELAGAEGAPGGQAARRRPQAASRVTPRLSASSRRCPSQARPSRQASGLCAWWSADGLLGTSVANCRDLLPSQPIFHQCRLRTKHTDVPSDNSLPSSFHTAPSILETMTISTDIWSTVPQAPADP